MNDSPKSPAELAAEINSRLFTAYSMVYLVGRLGNVNDGQILEVHLNEWSKTMGSFISDTQIMADTLESTLREGQGHE